MEINSEEFERQRRKSILDSNKYLKFEIIIGVEQDEMNEHIGCVPSTLMEMKHVGPQQIGQLYLCLQEMIKHLEEEYPVDCLAAKLTSKCTNLGNFDYDINKEKEN